MLFRIIKIDLKYWNLYVVSALQLSQFQLSQNSLVPAPRVPTSFIPVFIIFNNVPAGRPCRSSCQLSKTNLIDQNRIFSVLKTFLVDHKKCAFFLLLLYNIYGKKITEKEKNWVIFENKNTCIPILNSVTTLNYNDNCFAPK
jgi:hypothetical protein